MASVKSSRSRAPVPSALVAPNGTAANGAPATENAVQLADSLKLFKTDSFDPDAYVQSKCQTMSEMPDMYQVDQRMEPEVAHQAENLTTNLLDKQFVIHERPRTDWCKT